MRQWVLLAALAIAISAAVTVGVQWIPLSNSVATPIPGPPASAGPFGKAVVEGDDLIHNFGVMTQDQTGTHTWVLKNEGEGDLAITVGNTTCSCTIANLEKGDNVLKPGESTEIKLTWDTKKNKGAFSQSADILTNDPARNRLTFVVKGEIRTAILVFPPEGLSFTGVTNDESHKRSLVLLSGDKPDLKVLSIAAPKRTAGEFTTEIEPLAPEKKVSLEVGDEHQVYDITVTFTPGSTLGDFQDELVITTDHPHQPETRIPIYGKVVGPISTSSSAVRGVARSKQGALLHLILSVRHQPETQFEVVRAPAGLEIAIEPVQQQANRAPDGTFKSRAYRLNVTVPAGTPPGQIQGEIVLKTDHPKVSELRIPVGLTVIGS